MIGALADIRVLQGDGMERSRNSETATPMSPTRRSPSRSVQIRVSRLSIAPTSGPREWVAKLAKQSLGCQPGLQAI